MEFNNNKFHKKNIKRKLEINKKYTDTPPFRYLARIVKQTVYGLYP